MKRYRLREGIVCRDIAGVYFAFDIHDKYLYRHKEIKGLDDIAYKILQIMTECEVFSSADISSKLLKNVVLPIGVSGEKVLCDIDKMIATLSDMGWVYERR